MSYKLNLIEDINEKALEFNSKTNTQQSFKSMGYPKACHFVDNDGNKILISQRAGNRIRAERKLKNSNSWGIIKFETAINTINWDEPMKDVKGNTYSI